MRLTFFAALLLAGARAEQFCFIQPGTDGAEPREICLDSETNNVTIAEAPADYVAPLAGLANDLDVTWVLVAGVLVFFMQCGFAMLEAGSVSEKNVLNIIYKNFMDVAIASIVFFVFGFAFAYGGDNDNAFIGEENFALSEETGDNYHSWFFQFAFAATASTIVSGSVAERCAINAYYAYSFIMSFIIYPVVVHWVWDTEGWISAFNPNSIGVNGLIDFAGSGVVHMVGGFAGLVAAYILGPRTGRFDPDTGHVCEIRPHSFSMQALGTFILWTGWYGFNCGSTLLASGGASLIAGRVAVTTTLAAGSAAIASALVGIAFMKDKNPGIVFDGILAGLVSITAGCATISPGASIAVGFMGGLIYYGFSKLLLKLKIDDPLDAFPIHGGCGMWGVIAVGIFSQREQIASAYGFDNDAIASGNQFGIQVLGVVAIAAWTIVTSALMFKTIQATVGFRVSLEMEQKGLDVTEHGGAAYTRERWKHIEMVEADCSKTTANDSKDDGADGNGEKDRASVEEGASSSSSDDEPKKAPTKASKTDQIELTVENSRSGG